LRRPSRERTLEDALENIARSQLCVELVLVGLDVPNDLAVDGARHAVLELEVHLGDSVLGEDGGIGDITCPACQSLCISIDPA
jgi:hypothetical protein